MKNHPHEGWLFIKSQESTLLLETTWEPTKSFRVPTVWIYLVCGAMLAEFRGGFGFFGFLWIIGQDMKQV